MGRQPRIVLALAVFALGGFACGATAQTPETLRHFDEGNRHYTNGEYAEAVRAYEAADSTNYRSAALYYNLGNAYYRLDDMGRAILNYERARLLEPENRAIDHSLRLAKTRTMDRFSQLPPPIWTSVWRKVEAEVGLRVILWVGLLLYLAAGSIVIARVLLERRQAWIRRVVAVLFAVSVPLILVSLISSRSEWVRPRCVVLDEVASVKVAPSDDAETETEIHEGLVVQTLNADSAWFRIRLPNGVTGWVDATALEKI